MININTLIFAATLLAALAASSAGTWLSIRLAQRFGALDHPGDRSSHESPTPRIGGIGIALGLFGVLFIWAIPPWPGASIRPDLGLAGMRVLAVGGLIAFGFGLADDLHGLHVSVKFGFQIFCAAAAVFVGTPLNALVLPNGAIFPFGALGALITAAWIVFFMNAFNFMDGINGQASVFGILASIGIVFPYVGGLNPSSGWESSAGYLFLFMGALAGFLCFNVRRPPKTFMGDGGAQMCGFILAVAAVQAGPTFAIAALLALWPFVYDVGFTLARRAARGENIFQAHRGHLYQRLLKTGLSHGGSLARGAAFHAVCLGASILYSAGALNQNAAPVQFGCLAAVAAATAAYTAHVWEREKRKKSQN